MRKRIEDPNQLNIEFPEENTNNNTKNDKVEAFDVTQDKELDLAESKSSEEALNNIKSFSEEVEYEREDPGEMYKISNVIMKIKVMNKLKKKKDVFLIMLL